MKCYLNSLYNNLDEAKAFSLSFTNFVYFYDDVSTWDFHTKICEKCGKTNQSADYLAPKANCKKATGILHSLEPGVNPELRDELIARFDITEDDFRPVRSKRGEIVYYQITPRHIMQPIHTVNNWPILAECPSCGAVYYDRPHQPDEKCEPFFFISQAALDDMHDINVTSERFMRNYPLFVISRRVFEYLIECFPRSHYFPFFLK